MDAWKILKQNKPTTTKNKQTKQKAPQQQKSSQIYMSNL